MAVPIYTALSIVEYAILSVLVVLAPGAVWWNVAPHGTADQVYAGTLTRAYVAQHQDGGGELNARLHSAGWSGLVVVRCLAADDTTARVGLARVVPAMAVLASPAGYQLQTRFDRALAIPIQDQIATRAAQWRITIRRIP